MIQIAMSLPNTDEDSSKVMDRLMAEGPCDAEISEEEIMEEVRAVRYDRSASQF